MALSALLTPTLSDYHWLRRHLHGSLHHSCVAVVYPTRALTYVPHICGQRHQQRWCKNFKVRGIFSIFNAEGTPVKSCRICAISHTMCDFTHSV